MVVVDPTGHGFVVAFRDEQGECERVQNPLRRAFPLTRLLEDLDELSGKREVVGIDTEVVPESLPQFETHSGNVAATGLQAVQLVIDLLRLLVDRALLEPPFAQVVLEIGVFALQLCSSGFSPGTGGCELLWL